MMIKLDELRKQISKANLKSEQIVQHVRVQKLNEMFDKLDGDKDGFITSNLIDLNCLNSELQIAFRPLLEELHQLG